MQLRCHPGAADDIQFTGKDLSGPIVLVSIENSDLSQIFLSALAGKMSLDIFLGDQIKAVQACLAHEAGGIAEMFFQTGRFSQIVQGIVGRNKPVTGSLEPAEVAQFRSLKPGGGNMLSSDSQHGGGSVHTLQPAAGG